MTGASQITAEYEPKLNAHHIESGKEKKNKKGKHTDKNKNAKHIIYSCKHKGFQLLY